MKIQVKLVLQVCLIAAFMGGLSLNPVLAQDKSAAPKKNPAVAEANVAVPESKNTRPIPFTGKLHEVDKKAKTITLLGKTKNRVFKIMPETKILRDGKPATLDQAVIGEEVGGQARKISDDNWETVSLRLGPKPESESKPTRKKGE